MKSKTIILNQKRNVSLTTYLQDVGGEYRYVTRRPAVLIIPGGGYQFCSDREADPVAYPFLQAGFQAFILRYSVKEDAVWPTPLEDYEQAMAMIRANAEDWNLYPDKIAVIGFSAGGHLAASAATMSKNRPDAAILGYAVTLGDCARECCPTAPDAVSAVDQNTPPCFLFATRTDQVVPVRNTIAMADALDKAGVAFECHIYAFGPHGFSTGDSSIQSTDSGLCCRAPNWVSDSIGWLRDVLGDFGPDGMTQPRCGTHVNADYDPFLSLDCTIGRLMGNPEAAKLLQPLLSRDRRTSASQSTAEMSDMEKRMKLRDALVYAHVPAETLKALADQLSAIPNI